MGKPENARDKTADLLADSLIYSGALPLISWDLNGQGVSLSAIGADGEVTLPVKVALSLWMRKHPGCIFNIPIPGFAFKAGAFVSMERL